MSVQITREDDDQIRIKTDRAGERAVSALLSRQEAESALTTLAGFLGYTVTPTGSSGDTTAPADVAAEDTGTQTGDTA